MRGVILLAAISVLLTTGVGCFRCKAGLTRKLKVERKLAKLCSPEAFDSARSNPIFAEQRKRYFRELGKWQYKYTMKGCPPDEWVELGWVRRCREHGEQLGEQENKPEETGNADPL